MKSRTTDQFRACFANLPEPVKEKARRAYRLWKSNPAHPGLRFKRVHASERMFSVRIDIGWRALGLVEDDWISWLWIGTHAEYDRLLKTL